MNLILNLVNPDFKDRNQIGYRIDTYPDGQKQIKINDCLVDFRNEDRVTVISRIVNGDDLLILMQINEILERSSITYKLFITYLLGSRTDRLFSYGQAITIDLVTSILDGFRRCERIFVMEPHSSRSTPNYKFIGINDFIMKYCLSIDRYFIRVFPDKGSLSRFSGICMGKVVCKKVRNISTGKLSHFGIDYKDCDTVGKPLYLVDDLCDGGGTFLGLCDVIRSELKPSELNLVVTHSIQESGLRNVSIVYDNVYTTNSYKDWDKIELPSNIKVFDVLSNYNNII